MSNQEKTITLLKSVLSQEDIEQQIKKSMKKGFLPPPQIEIEKFRDCYVPYYITEVIFSLGEKRKRKCYVFENMANKARTVIYEIENLEFKETNIEEEILEVEINSDEYSKELTSYLKFDVLAKNFKNFVDWKIEIISIKSFYRINRVMLINVKGKIKSKSIFLDGFGLK